MTASVRNSTALVALVLVCIGAVISIKYMPAVLRLRDSLFHRRAQGEIIRRPTRGISVTPAKSEMRDGLVNIAPYATVTVSSNEEASGQAAEGVADGSVDTKEWVTSEGSVGAWIQFDWEHPATVAEVVLHDRHSLAENVLGGTLLFDDGIMIPVPALPVDGSAWSVRFTPKVVHWIRFRIDSVQGSNAGLREVLIYGTPYP